MKKLDRYIGVTVLTHIFVVLLILLALQTFFSFLDEMKQVGRGQYDTLAALEFILLSAPRKLYEMLPAACLVGSLLGLGSLSSSSELTVMRAAGVATGRIVFAVLKSAVWLLLFALLIGEGVMPPLQKLAYDRRSSAIAGRVDSLTSGVWMREQESFVSIESVIGTDLMVRPRIFALDAQWQVTKVIDAQSAVHKQGQWWLNDVVTTDFKESAVVVQQQPQLRWDTGFTPEIVDLLAIRPDMLSLFSLGRYIQYLEANQTHSKRYQLAFWNKIIAPCTILIMVLLAAPLAMGNCRSGQMGRNLFLGVLGGVILNMMDRMFTNMGMIYPIPAFVAALLPSLLFLGLALWLLKRAW